MALLKNFSKYTNSDSGSKNFRSFKKKALPHFTTPAELKSSLKTFKRYYNAVSISFTICSLIGAVFGL